MTTKELRAYRAELEDLDAEHGGTRYRERIDAIDAILATRPANDPDLRLATHNPQEMLRLILDVVQIADERDLPGLTAALAAILHGDATPAADVVAITRKPVDKAPVNDDHIARLQSRYDRLTAYRGRLIRYHDDCPDGDPRKAEAEATLNRVGQRIVDVERELDRLIP